LRCLYTIQNHLDDYNFLPFSRAKSQRIASRILLLGSGADMMAVRYDDWNINFKTIEGNLLNGQAHTTTAPSS